MRGMASLRMQATQCMLPALPHKGPERDNEDGARTKHEEHDESVSQHYIEAKGMQMCHLRKQASSHFGAVWCVPE